LFDFRILSYRTLAGSISEQLAACEKQVSAAVRFWTLRDPLEAVSMSMQSMA
jgi:hypothetical protein